MKKESITNDMEEIMMYSKQRERMDAIKDAFYSQFIRVNMRY